MKDRLVPLAPWAFAAGATVAVGLARDFEPEAWLLVGILWLAATRLAVRTLRRERLFRESLEQLSATVARWAAGDLTSRVYLDSADPLDALAHDMNRVAEALAERTADLTRDNQQLEAILSSMQNGIVIFDRALYITLINRAALALFGLKEEQAIGRHVLEVIRAAPIERALQAVTRSGRPEVVEWAPDPTVDTVVECSMAPVGQPGGGYGAVLVARDITAERRLNRMRADFVANVSHELQTPLTTIIGFSEALLEDPPADPDQGRRFLTLIHDEAERLSRLVDDLLALSRLEHHSLPVRQDVVDLGAIGAEVVLQLTPRAREAGLDLALEPAENPVTTRGDPDLLKEVVLNLVSNAIQYTPAGGQIRVRVRRVDGAVELAVADTGIGIPPADQPRIFERFYRVDKDRSRRSGGTGLGLAIVKHIVESHHGRVTVESEVGKGSTFTVRLPPGD